MRLEPTIKYLAWKVFLKKNVKYKSCEISNGASNGFDDVINMGPARIFQMNISNLDTGNGNSRQFRI